MTRLLPRRFRPQVEWLESRHLLNARVLVFSKTAGFRHDAIADGTAALRQLGGQYGYTVDATEDANQFTDAVLGQYQAVVFLLTTGDVLNPTQELAFERYVRAGGGYMGVHSAADTEYGWAWYGRLMGAYFQSHPAIQAADSRVEDHYHPSTLNVPTLWHRTDEWYNYRTNPRVNGVTVLATLDESTYQGGTMGADHPISWYQWFEGSRSWYTGMGHTRQSYQDYYFREHLAGGLRFAVGDPLTLTGYAAQPTRVDLYWTDFSYDPTVYYFVERTRDGVEFETIGSFGTPAASYSDTTAAPSTWYAYRLWAYTSSSALVYSNFVWVQTPGREAPGGDGSAVVAALVMDALPGPVAIPPAPNASVDATFSPAAAPAVKSDMLLLPEPSDDGGATPSLAAAVADGPAAVTCRLVTVHSAIKMPFVDGAGRRFSCLLTVGTAD